MKDSLFLTFAGRQLATAQARLALLMAPRLHRLCPSDLEPLWDDLNAVAASLTSAGVPVVDEQTQGTPPPAPDSLETLTRLHKSQAEGKALLTALENLLPLAEALDKARGNWVGDMADIEHGETPGTNYAEAIQELHLRLLAEVRGAKGCGRE